MVAMMEALHVSLDPAGASGRGSQLPGGGSTASPVLSPAPAPGLREGLDAEDEDDKIGGVHVPGGGSTAAGVQVPGGGLGVKIVVGGGELAQNTFREPA